MSMDELTIRDSNNTFGQLYPEIKRGFEMLCESTGDVIANIGTMQNTINDFNLILSSSLSSYQQQASDIISTINSRNSELSGLTAEIQIDNMLTGNFEKLDTLDSSISEMNSLSTALGLRSVTVYSGLNYYEEAIKHYSGGLLPTLGEFANTYLDEDGNLTYAAYTALSCVQAALEEIGGYAGLSFVVGFAAHQLTDKGTVWGDRAAKAADVITNCLDLKNLPMWFNAGVGTFVCSVYNLVDEIITDEGEWTDLDKKRLAIRTVGSGIEYLSWAEIAAVVGGGIGGPIGAIAGTAVAALVLIPVSAFINYVGDLMTGDNKIDTFTRHGRTYSIPRNGSGKNGTFDVILERSINNYDDVVSDRLSKQNLFSLYDDWEVFLLQHSPSFRDEYDKGQITPELIDMVYEVLNDVKLHNNRLEYFNDVYLYNAGFNNKENYYAAARFIKKYLIDDWTYNLNM